MNSQKFELNIIILQPNLAIGSTDFIGIVNQVRCIDNQFILKFQTITLHVFEQSHGLVPIFTTSHKSLS